MASFGAIKNQVHELKRKSKHKNKSRESFAMHKHESCDRKRKEDPFQQNNKQKMRILITCTRFHLSKLSPKAVYTLTSL